MVCCAKADALLRFLSVELGARVCEERKEGEKRNAKRRRLTGAQFIGCWGGIIRLAACLIRLGALGLLWQCALVRSFVRSLA